MDRPALLMLPGLDGLGTTSGPFLEHLGNQLRAVRVSYPDRPHLSRIELANYVLARWPADGPVIVLGESFSTAVAVGVAAARPPRLAGVVLVTPAFAARPRWLPRTAVRLYPRWAPVVSPPAFALRWLLLGGSADATELTHAVGRSDPRVLLARLREYLADPAADDPAGVGVPVMAIRAGRDRLLSAGSPEPRAGLEWVTVDAPHLVLAAAPAAAAELVAGFASRVCDSARE